MSSKEFFSLNSAVPSKELIGTGARQVRTTTDLSQIRLSDSFPSFKQQVGHAQEPALHHLGGSCVFKTLSRHAESCASHVWQTPINRSVGGQ